MQTSWKNLYKATNVFSCPHRLHKHHENGTSAWHILKYKQCHPQGCVSFNWRCRQFEQNHKCPRGKKHVGKDCFSCPYFYDEKLSFQPETSLSTEEYADFTRRFAEFEEWVEDLQKRRIEVRGEVTAIHPWLIKNGDEGRNGISCRGVLLYFRRGIFRYDIFLDPFYSRLSFRTYERARITPGDEIDFVAELVIDRGRFVFCRAGNIDIVKNSGGPFLNSASLRQAKFTGSEIDGQPAKCLSCPNGLLIDRENGDGRRFPRRVMYCTKGVADYRYCPYWSSQGEPL